MTVAATADLGVVLAVTDLSSLVVRRQHYWLCRISLASVTATADSVAVLGAIDSSSSVVRWLRRILVALVTATADSVVVFGAKDSQYIFVGGIGEC